MDDLVKRLRDKAARGGVIPIHDVTLEQAADEIERLRAALMQVLQTVSAELSFVRYMDEPHGCPTVSAETSQSK